MDNFGIALVILLGVILLLFMIIRNKKDRKKLEEQLNNDYRKAREGGNDVETEEGRQ